MGRTIFEAQMQANQLQAGIEQRRQEWRMQQTAAAAGRPWSPPPRW